MKKVLVAALSAILLAGAAQAAGGVPDQSARPRVEQVKEFMVAQRRSCSAARTCEEAVEMWCGGYSGADRDRDGIPCESVCRSKSQVDAIRQRIGC
jgi:opacity protein-like surface antigen